VPDTNPDDNKTPAVQSLDVCVTKEGKICACVGTRKGQIWEADLMDGKFSREAHGNSAEVWALATHPKKPLIAVGGDDGTVTTVLTVSATTTSTATILLLPLFLLFLLLLLVLLFHCYYYSSYNCY
jgi:WD40 repeat protein